MGSGQHTFQNAWAFTPASSQRVPSSPDSMLQMFIMSELSLFISVFLSPVRGVLLLRGGGPCLPASQGFKQQPQMVNCRYTSTSVQREWSACACEGEREREDFLPLSSISLWKDVLGAVCPWEKAFGLSGGQRQKDSWCWWPHTWFPPQGVIN